MKRCWRERRLHRDDAASGYTLAELLVVMVITAILALAVGGLFAVNMRTTETASATTVQVNDARTAMETMTRLIRSAVRPASLADCSQTPCPASEDSAFYVDATRAPGPTSMSFYADIDNPVVGGVGPSEVTFTVTANGSLVETIQPPDSGSDVGGFQWTDCTRGAAGCSLRQYVVATGIVASAGKPLFTYYENQPSGIPVREANPALPLPQPPTYADYQNVDAVDIALTVKHAGGGAATSLVQRVSLNNVDTYLQCSGSC